MIKIARLVLAPLLIGIFLRRNYGHLLSPFLPRISLCNQLGILTVVWMGVCQGRAAIIHDISSLFLVIAVTALYHFLLLTTGFVATNTLGIGKSRRESVILMGGQKTLPLSIILQVSLFSEYGLALAVCVIHHIVHLAMDAFVVNTLRRKG